MVDGFFELFILTPSLTLLAFIGYWVCLAVYKKKQKEQKERERIERERREEEERERFCKYLSEHPAAEKAFKEEIWRKCKQNEKHKARFVCRGWNTTGIEWE